MRFRLTAVVPMLSMFILAAGVVLTRKPASPTTVHDVLPRVAAPRAVEAMTRQLNRGMIFVDPATGELRAPSAGEQQALAGQQPAGAVRIIEAPGEGAAARRAASNLDFLLVTTGPGGTVSFRHSRPTSAAGGRHVR